MKWGREMSGSRRPVKKKRYVSFYMSEESDDLLRDWSSNTMYSKSVIVDLCVRKCLGHSVSAERSLKHIEDMRNFDDEAFMKQLEKFKQRQDQDQEAAPAGSARTASEDEDEDEDGDGVSGDGVPEDPEEAYNRASAEVLKEHDRWIERLKELQSKPFDPDNPPDDREICDFYDPLLLWRRE